MLQACLDKEEELKTGNAQRKQILENIKKFTCTISRSNLCLHQLQ